MVRAPDAPVETAKFMGHGFCDNVTKLLTLPTHTSELSVISDTVFSIKKILNVPAHDLRGIGIQISKLNTSSMPSNDANKKNRLKIMFENAQAKQNMNTMTDDDVGHRGKISTFQKVKSFNGIPSPNVGDKQNLSNKKLNKLYENLDLSMLAELPRDIQDEILREQDRILNNHMNNFDYRPAATVPSNIDPLKKSFARKLENDFNYLDLKPPAQITSTLVSIFNSFSDEIHVKSIEILR